MQRPTRPGLAALCAMAAWLGAPGVSSAQQNAAPITLDQGESRDVGIRITSTCSTQQTFKVESAAPWIRFTSGTTTSVPGHGSAPFGFTIDSRGTEAGSHTGTVSVICTSCESSVPVCSQDRKDFSLSLVVNGPPKPPEGGGGGAGGGRKTPAGPERQEIPGNRTPSPKPVRRAADEAGLVNPANPPEITRSDAAAKNLQTARAVANVPVAPPVTPNLLEYLLGGLLLAGGIATLLNPRAKTQPSDNVARTTGDRQQDRQTPAQTGNVPGDRAGTVHDQPTTATGDTPVTQAPVTQTPVTRTPVSQTPISQTPVSASDTPITQTLPPAATVPATPPPATTTPTVPTTPTIPGAAQTIGQPPVVSGGSAASFPSIPSIPITGTPHTPTLPAADPHVSATPDAGTPVSDVVPQGRVPPKKIDGGSWDATLEIPTQDVAPHAAAGGTAGDHVVFDKAGPTNVPRGRWDATLEFPPQGVLAQAPLAARPAIFATSYIDPKDNQIHSLPGEWVRLGPTPPQPGTYGGLVMPEYPVDKEPRLLVNPRTGEQQWVDWDGTGPEGWVKEDPLIPRGIGRPGADYVGPTGKIAHVPDDWVKLQPAPPHPDDSSPIHPHYTPGAAPRLYVDPKTGEQTWVRYKEKPPEGWIERTGVDPFVPNFPASAPVVDRPADQKSDPKIAKDDAAKTDTGKPQAAQVIEPKPGDLNPGGGHTFSRGTRQQDLDKANTLTQEELAKAKEYEKQHPGPIGRGDSEVREAKYRDALKNYQENKGRPPSMSADQAPPSSEPPWDGHYDPMGESEWIKGVQQDKAAAEARLKKAIDDRWGGNTGSIGSDIKGAAYDQVYGDPIRHEQDLILRRVWQLEIYKKAYRDARLAGLGNLAAHAYADIQVAKWRDQALKDFEQTFGTHFAQFGQAISGDPLGNLNKAIEQIGVLVDEAAANVRKSRELAKAIEKQRAQAQAAAEAEEALQGMEGPTGAARKGLAPALDETAKGIAKEIEGVNIQTGSNGNCVSCSVATDSALAGKPLAALPYPDGMDTMKAVRWIRDRFNIKALPKWFGGGTKAKAAITQTMMRSGEGSRAIVIVKFADGTGATGNHAFNVIVRNGKVYFPDGQKAGFLLKDPKFGYFFDNWQYVEQSTILPTFTP